jgi:hypothetical protein
MSHLVTIQTKVHDRIAVATACQKLGFEPPMEGKAKLYSGEAAGLLVKLPGWMYPIVCQLETGEVRFDNFEGRWGDRAELDRFLQRYAVEKAVLEARRRGHSVVEQALKDGSIKLTIQIGANA